MIRPVHFPKESAAARRIAALRAAFPADPPGTRHISRL
jgi:hypothetical protein